MEGFSFLSVLILFGAVQGIILVFAINRIEQKNSKANKILSLFILLISVVLISRLVYIEGTTIWLKHPHLFLIPDITMFLYGPTFFLYIKSLLNPAHQFKSKIWVHFVPFFCHLMILGFYLFEPKEIYLERLMTGNLWEVPYASFLALLHIAFYFVWSYRLYSEHKRQFLLESDNKYPLDYLKYFYFLAGICWLIWMYSSIVPYLKGVPNIPFFSYNLSWVALSFVTFLLAYFAMSQKEVFKLVSFKKKYENSLLSKEKMDALELKLRLLMQDTKPYLDNKLSRQKLAQQMQLHPKDLSRLINERFRLNFFDFINSYRVEEFQKISDKSENKHLNLLGIAFEAGFNSKTTFNNAFKKFTGMTPNQFIKKKN